MWREKAILLILSFEALESLATANSSAIPLLLTSAHAREVHRHLSHPVRLQPPQRPRSTIQTFQAFKAQV